MSGWAVTRTYTEDSSLYIYQRKGTSADHVRTVEGSVLQTQHLWKDVEVWKRKEADGVSKAQEVRFRLPARVRITTREGFPPWRMSRGPSGCLKTRGQVSTGWGNPTEV